MDDIEQLKKWNELKESGVITAEEFEQKKKTILEGKTDLCAAKKGLWRNYFSCLKKYFTLSGRASRYEFWGFILIDSFVSFFFVFASFFSEILSIFSIIYALILIIPRITVTVRRLHDINRRGWWVLLPSLILIVMAIVAALCAIAEYRGMQTQSAVKTVFFIIGGFSTLLSYIYVFYLLCKKGNGTSNRFGKVDDCNNDVVGRRIMIGTLILILLSMSAMFMVGFSTGYSRAKQKHLINKSINQVEVLSSKIKMHYAGEKYDGLSNASIAGFDIVPEEMLSTTEVGKLLNPYGGEAMVNGKNASFVVAYKGIPQDACNVMLAAKLQGEGFVGMKVNGHQVSLCVCTNGKCLVEWEFK